MPLTLDDLRYVRSESVYLEYRYPEYNSGYRKTVWVRAWIGYPDAVNYALYGKTWRCWLRKPTEEETRNAEWREG